MHKPDPVTTPIPNILWVLSFGRNSTVYKFEYLYWQPVTYVEEFDGSFERKTRGRLLYLAKRFGPKRAFFSCKRGVQNISLNHQIPIYRCGNESLLFHLPM